MVKRQACECFVFLISTKYYLNHLNKSENLEQVHNFVQSFYYICTLFKYQHNWVISYVHLFLYTQAYKTHICTTEKLICISFMDSLVSCKGKKLEMLKPQMATCKKQIESTGQKQWKNLHKQLLCSSSPFLMVYYVVITK